MSERTEVTLRFRVQQRMVEVKAYDSVGVEDAYTVAMKAVMHRYVTGEELVAPTPREIKDWVIRTNLFV